MRGTEDIEEEFETIKQNYWEVEQEQLNKCTCICNISAFKSNPVIKTRHLAGRNSVIHAHQCKIGYI